MTELEAASEVCVSFRLSRSEFEAAMHRMFWVLWQASMTLYAGALLLVVAVVGTLTGGSAGTIPLFGLALVWFAAAAWVYWVSPRRQYRVRQRASAEQTHCFSDSGSTAHFVDAETRMAWSLYGEIRETRDVYLLRLENRAVNIIPKRAFKSSRDEATFRDLARRHAKVKFQLEPLTA